MAASKVLVAVAIVLSAALLAEAQAPCAGTGAYHLSCYTANVPAAAANAAKTECFTAWNKPECAAALAAAPAGTGGCPTPILYKFATADCRDSYQSSEKTLAACAQYKAAGLGNAANRATATIPADYTCP